MAIRSTMPRFYVGLRSWIADAPRVLWALMLAGFALRISTLISRELPLWRYSEAIDLHFIIAERLPNILADVISIALAYDIGKRLGTQREALIAAGLTTFNSWSVGFSAMGDVYAPFGSVSALLTFAAIRSSLIGNLRTTWIWMFAASLIAPTMCLLAVFIFAEHIVGRRARIESFVGFGLTLGTSLLWFSNSGIHTVKQLQQRLLETFIETPQSMCLDFFTYPLVGRVTAHAQKRYVPMETAADVSNLIFAIIAGIVFMYFIRRLRNEQETPLRYRSLISATVVISAGSIIAGLWYWMFPAIFLSPFLWLCGNWQRRAVIFFLAQALLLDKMAWVMNRQHAFDAFSVAVLRVTTLLLFVPFGYTLICLMREAQKSAYHARQTLMRTPG